MDLLAKVPWNEYMFQDYIPGSLTVTEQEQP